MNSKKAFFLIGAKFGTCFWHVLLNCFLILITSLVVDVHAFENGAALDLSLINEKCYLEQDTSLRAKTGAVFRIICSGHEVGTLISDVQSRLRTKGERLQCLPATSIDNGQGSLPNLMIEPCRQKNNSLPFALIKFKSEGLNWVADGPPSIISSILRLAKLPNLSEAQRKELIERLPKLWDGPVALLTGLQLHLVRTMLRDAMIANHKGDYELASNLLRELLAIQSQVIGSESVVVGETLLDLALNVSNQGRFLEAEALFRRAERLIAPQSSGVLRARLKNYRSLDSANKNEFAAALAHARDAVNTWSKLRTDSLQNATEFYIDSWDGNSRSRLTAELAYALHLESAMLLRNEDSKTAHERATEALRLATSVQGFPLEWRAELMMTLGECAMALGKTASAEEYFKTAKEIRQFVFGSTLPTIKTTVVLGRAYYSEGIDTSAISAYRDAFTSIINGASIKSEFLSSEELIDFVASSFNLIARNGFSTAQRVQLLEEVFFAFQNVRANVVDKTITKAAAALADSTPGLGIHLKEMMSIERTIASKRSDLAEQNVLMDDDRDAKLEVKLVQEINSLEDALKEKRKDLIKIYPSYASFATSSPIPLKEFQSKFQENEALVSYIFGRKDSYALLIKKGGMHLIRIPLSEFEILKSVQKIRKGLQPQAGRLESFDVAESNDLYRLVLGSFEAYLKDIDHLIVNANGPLASLPFAVLVSETPTEASDNLNIDTAWLSRQFAISHISSIQSFLTLRKRKQSNVASKPFFGVGNPVLSGKSNQSFASLDKLAGDCRPDQPASSDMIRALAALPDTGNEIQNVAKVFGSTGQWRLGEAAKEEDVRRLQLDQYRVLYFATHGLLPGELKCQVEPALVLTPPEIAAKEKSKDGLLQASEISTLKINADLVVLSACNTAGSPGKTGGGEALSGLAEAFFYAGAKGLVVSHWQVPSEPTSKLMTNMFRLIKKDFSGGAAKALSSAQYVLSTNPKTAHPYYWAAFTVIGDGGDPIYSKLDTE